MRGYAEFLARVGYEVTLVADDLTGLEGELTGSGVSVHSLPMSRDPDPIRDLVSLARIGRLIARLRPDAVIYATPKASLLTSIAARLFRVPVRIYELWGIRFETSKGLARRLFRAIEQVVASCSTAIVANSASLAARAVELGITRGDRVVVLGHGSSHGVDSERFSRRTTFPKLDAATEQFLSDTSGLTVGFVGRLHPDKGIDTLLAAAAKAAADGGMRILLVGGDEGISLTIPDGIAVHLAGDVGDVRPYLAAFDVLVLMSLREGFPNVVLEAAAMEVPAIVSNATGCVDSVIDGVTGRIVATGDVASLSQTLTELARDAKIRRSLALAARRRVLEDFDPEAVWGLAESHLRTQLAKSCRGVGTSA